MVYHELHVARSRSFSACSGYLFTQIGSRDDLLGKRNSIVFEVNNLESISNDGIVVDHISDVIDQTDYLLGNMITWSSFAANLKDDSKNTISKRTVQK